MSAQQEKADKATSLMQDALDMLLDVMETEKSILLADAVDHLAMAINYLKGETNF